MKILIHKISTNFQDNITSRKQLNLDNICKIRIIRDGIVEYPKGEGQSAELGSLKRFKDDAKEVVSNMECGLTIKNFIDLKVGDIVEAFEEEEVKRTL